MREWDNLRLHGKATMVHIWRELISFSGESNLLPILFDVGVGTP